MREVTWPSRSFLIFLVANLTNAWVLVAIITRLVKNKLLRNFLKWTAWIYFALRIFWLRQTRLCAARFHKNLASVRWTCRSWSSCNRSSC